jgi:hypothetical protein
MSTAPKRATVYFKPEIHRALRVKAAESDCSISELVNEAVKETLAEDAEDLAAFEDRARERTTSFEKIVRRLRQSGDI